MSPRLTERAEATVALASEEALTLGHTYVGVEHLLLGILRADAGAGYRALQRSGVTYPAARAVRQRHIDAMRRNG